jgi:WD40 repeat protein
LGHTDTVTSLQLSPDNTTLLSNAHDSTVRTWDVRPFAPADRRIQTYDGAPTGQERNLLKASWDSKGERIAAGSGDQSVAIWEARTGKLLNKLPGHRGAVNDVRFHPQGEPLCKSSLPSSSVYRMTFSRKSLCTCKESFLFHIRSGVLDQERPGLHKIHWTPASSGSRQQPFHSDKDRERS